MNGKSSFIPLDPDFERLRITLMREGEPDRVPNAELHVDWQIKEAFLGRPIETIQDDVDFWYRAGYDYIYLRANYEYRMVGDGLADEDHIYAGDMQVTEWAGDETSLVSSWEDYENYPWPDPETIDYSNLVECAGCLYPGMKIISGVGGIFTRVWRIMGFDTFSFATVDQPDLVAELFRRVGETQLAVFRRIVEMDGIGAMWYGDDLAYKSGTMVHPDLLREHLFPYLREMGRICREHDLPFVMHSDGDLTEILPDLLEAGLNGLHPLEPMAMDSAELKAEYGSRLCLLGNIEIGEVLTNGTPEDVEREVREKIRTLAPGGGYAVGSSNTVAHYVRLENYRAMIAATRRWGQYPLGDAADSEVDGEQGSETV